MVAFHLHRIIFSIVQNWGMGRGMDVVALMKTCLLLAVFFLTVVLYCGGIETSRLGGQPVYCVAFEVIQ